MYIYIYIYVERERRRSWWNKYGIGYIVGRRNGDLSSNPGRGLSHSTNTLGKGMNYSPISYGVEGDQKAPFSIATTPRCWEGHYSFLWITPLYP